ncbi:MAG: sodium-dependent bicarbonate transport family permease [Flavobacteriaceae bacterium]
MPMALAITFPFNITLGMPIYISSNRYNRQQNIAYRCN